MQTLPKGEDPSEILATIETLSQFPELVFGVSEYYLTRASQYIVEAGARYRNLRGCGLRPEAGA
jgi:hypothetical protein